MPESDVGASRGLDEAGPELVIARVFDASRELVFKASTEIDHFKHWWRPRGFEWVSAKLDLCPGGIFHSCKRARKGSEMWGKFVYREIAPPERIVFLNSFSEPDGGVTPNPWIPDWPREVLHTVTFAERDGRTAITMHGRPINATEIELKNFDAGCQSVEKGSAPTFNTLDEYLASVRHAEET